MTLISGKGRTDGTDYYRHYSNSDFDVYCIHGLCHWRKNSGEVMEPVVTLFVVLWLVGVLSG